jgi:hypothetical protein
MCQSMCAGLQVFHCADAFATLVVVDAREGRPAHIPFTLTPVTQEEQLRAEVGGGQGGPSGSGCCRVQGLLSRALACVHTCVPSQQCSGGSALSNHSGQHNPFTRRSIGARLSSPKEQTNQRIAIGHM